MSPPVAALVLAIVCTAVVVLAASHEARSKVESASSLIVSPSRYLDTDRGTYLINTLNMVRSRPFGVGVGDWQTWYPVFRIHDRYRAFSEAVQVRRAHSDYVQLLGELGWFGLGLWIAAVGAAIWAAARRACGVEPGWDRAAGVAAQLVSLAAAGVTDYLIEFPYGKFQFVLVFFLCLAFSQRSTPRARWQPSRLIGRMTITAGVMALAVVNISYSVSQIHKDVLGAQLDQAYRAAVGKGSSGEGGLSVAPSSVDLTRVVKIGMRFESAPGNTKTSYRGILLTADAWHRLGRDDVAAEYAHRALTLHPHHPNAFSLMSRLSSDEASARDWQAASGYITHEAAHGFDRPYPEGHPLARDPG